MVRMKIVHSACSTSIVLVNYRRIDHGIEKMYTHRKNLMPRVTLCISGNLHGVDSWLHLVVKYVLPEVSTCMDLYAPIQ